MMSHEEIKESILESRRALTCHFEAFHRVNGLRCTLNSYKTLDRYDKILESQKTLSEEDLTHLSQYQEILRKLLQKSKEINDLDQKTGLQVVDQHLDLFDDILQNDKNFKKNNDSERDRLPLPVRKEFKRFVGSLHTFLRQATRKNKNFYIGALEKYSDNTSFAREEEEHGVSIVIRIRRKSPVQQVPLQTTP